jgi:hypothetical protein
VSHPAFPLLYLLFLFLTPLLPLRVINVLKKWLERFWGDFCDNLELQKKLGEFIDQMSLSMPGSAWAPRLRDLIEEKKNTIIPKPPTPPPVPHRTKGEKRLTTGPKTANFLKNLITGGNN